MKFSKYFKKYDLLFSAFLVLSFAYFISSKYERPYLIISKQSSSINLNHKLITNFSLGFSRLISSSLWISTILESDIEHYQHKDLNSWMYLRFNTIAMLEPDFYENYAFGGPYLSVIKDDISGATEIFNKGLNRYPNDFFLVRDAGFHFYFEEKDFKKAHSLFSILVNKYKSLNPLILSMFTRLEAGVGNLDTATFVLESLQKIHSTDTFIGKKIYENRYSIKAEIDLDCLNKNRNDCQLSDLDGNRYIYRKGKFYAQRNWIPYRVK